ncbi:F-box only protein 9 [Amyelois transitella]|uniref:F-box only protein 9 n=1 Tax=Amyelois transitella TaxID=680683 RepID=UPI00067B5704|nr:F-box only protein 9 [Amyelois transitella]
MASSVGSTDGPSGECEEPEDSSSPVAEVSEGLANIDLEEPQDELSAFRQQWQQELESTPTTDTEREEENRDEHKMSQSDEDKDELSAFRQQWQRELESTPTPGTERQEENREEHKLPQSDEDKAKSLFMRAVELERGGDLYEAIQHYKRAMQILPDVESRLYESGELGDEPEEQSEPEEAPTENNNQSDDEEWIEGEDLLARIQRLVAKKGTFCEPEHPTKETHISCLPSEVVSLVLRWVAGAECDARSLERAAAASRGWLLLARAAPLYRDLCVRTWGVECGTPRALGFPSWRDMYISRPRLLLHGCYISKTTYLRQGENSFQDQFYRPLFLINYYRYLRFFPEGTVLMWTTAEEPASCVSQLKTRQPKASLGIMAGHYRLMGDKVVIVIKKCPDKKQPQSINSRFRSRRRDAPEQHDQIYHVELELRDVRSRRNFQLAWRGYSICTRRDQRTQFDITPAKFPPFMFSGVRSYMAESAAPL